MWLAIEYIPIYVPYTTKIPIDDWAGSYFYIQIDFLSIYSISSMEWFTLCLKQKCFSLLFLFIFEIIKLLTLIELLLNTWIFLSTHGFILFISNIGLLIKYYINGVHRVCAKNIDTPIDLLYFSMIMYIEDK